MEFEDEDPKLRNVRYEANPGPRPKSGSPALKADDDGEPPAEGEEPGEEQYIGAFGMEENWLEEWTFFGPESDYDAQAVGSGECGNSHESTGTGGFDGVEMPATLSYLAANSNQDMPTISVLQAAAEILREVGQAHYRDIAREIQNRGLASLGGKTPEATVNAKISLDIKLHGDSSEFVRLTPGVYGVRNERTLDPSSEDPLGAEQEQATVEDHGTTEIEAERRVRVPLFPVYEEARHVLRVWPGWTRKQITGFHSTLAGLRGTPQSTVDWRDPDKWIPERLEGDDHHLAKAIWTKSVGMVNPRHTTGHWLLCQKYELLEEVGGRLGLTQKGQSFVDHENGAVEAFIDEQEGVAKILSLVAANGPTGVRGVLEEWSAYLTRHSAFGSPSTRRDTLRRRLRNLVYRGLVSRKSTLYAATESGLAYLKRLGKEEALGNHRYQDLLAQAQQQSESVREELRQLLLEMDSFAFEHLVKRLLEEMDYQDVEVTKKSGDGGVDVIAEIELGITSVKEVVQAKRHRGTIQRKVLDALRGSLHRFGAVRGTIIATSGFSSGTKKAAFEAGVAPITLVDGNKLIDLLIKHGIGVRKRTIEVLAVDAEALDDLVADD